MLICKTCSWFFFFFQAEDGIRDLYVTGVQTCALPICERSPPVHRPSCRREERELRPRCFRRKVAERDRSRRRGGRIRSPRRAPRAVRPGALPTFARRRRRRYPRDTSLHIPRSRVSTRRRGERERCTSRVVRV